MKKSILIILLILAVCTTLFSQPDTAIHINANRILMYAGNNGIIANDFFGEIDSTFEGFYYGEDDRYTLMFAGGLWITSKISREIFTGMAYYSAGRTYTEFVPGPLDGNIEDSSELRVYKITRDDLQNPGQDYLEWPSEWGAPVDSAGDPLLLGDETLFSIYNDTDTTRRGFTAGSKLPMYSEVRQTIHAYNKDKALGDVVFVEYEIINRSAQRWDSVYVGQFTDPDIGTPFDDFLGSSPQLDLTYVYSDSLDEELAGIGYPLVGTVFLGAEKSGRPRYEQSTSSTARVIQFFPISREESMYMMRGLNYGGVPYADPQTGEIKSMPLDGDARYDVGWVDNDPEDKRTLISRGPFYLMPGDTLRIHFALIALSRAERIEAFNDFFDLAEKVGDWHNLGPHGLALASESDDGFISAVRFKPVYQNWIEPVPFVNDFANMGTGRAEEIFESSIRESEYISVELKFGSDNSQNVYYYNRSDDSWDYAGFLELPVSAYEKESGQQLDLLFLTDNAQACDFCFINPRNDPERFYRLLVVASDYSGTERDDYIFDDVIAGMGELDLMYLIQFRARSKSLVHNIQNGQSLEIEYLRPQLSSSQIELQFDTVPVGTEDMLGYLIVSDYQSDYNVRIEFSNPTMFSSHQPQYIVPGELEQPVYFSFHPRQTDVNMSTAQLYNLNFEEYFAEIEFSGGGAVWPLIGDINLNGWLEPSDIAAYIGYLYRDFELPADFVELDLGPPAGIDLSDVMRLINIVFQPVD